MTFRYTPSLTRLIGAFVRLPGIGVKTAQRLAFYLLKAPRDEVLQLAETIVELKEKIRFCRICFNIAEEETCPVCQDPGRDRGILCVVEEANDLLAVEKSGEFKGLYHVLHGSLSPLEGRGPDDLLTKELLARLQAGEVKEVIIATNPNVEGEATALYLQRLIRPLGVRVSRIAHGLPVGGDLEYADEVTVARALEGRREMR
ncbi:MAG: recombination mediator RecR [Candidatus Methylomirabilales bacterium]